jgi:hypothetical protein
VQLNEATVEKHCSKHINNLRNTWMIKLPRFQIYHNASEDYYFIKEKVFLFWYSTLMTLTSYDYYTVSRFESLAMAEAYIEVILMSENQSKTPDEIKLVKEYDT